MFIKKKEITKLKSVPVDPYSMPEPIAIQDYFQRGMAFYARKLYDAAEKDLRRVVELDPKSVDGFYGLGMVYKAAKRNAEAIQSFEEAIRVLREGAVENHNKSEMLRRLALGHVNELKTGDWDMEKEIWHHIQ